MDSGWQRTGACLVLCFFIYLLELYVTFASIFGFSIVAIIEIKREFGVNPKLSRSCKFLVNQHVKIYHCFGMEMGRLDVEGISQNTCQIETVTGGFRGLKQISILYRKYNLLILLFFRPKQYYYRMNLYEESIFS